MIDFKEEESLRSLLKAAYTPATAPPELRARLYERLTLEASGIGHSRPFYERSKVLVPLLVAIATGLIGYGSWLSQSVIPTMLP